MRLRALVKNCLSMLCVLTGIIMLPCHANGRLLASGGATEIEGAAGGGLVPWAVLAGYGTRDELGGTASFNYVNTGDYSLNVIGAAFTWKDRVELSYARHSFDLGTLGADILPAAFGINGAGKVIRQNVFGAKVRLLGDLVYTPFPQFSAGVQYKQNLDFGIPRAVGARDDQGTDFYLAASKLFLAGLFGRNVLLNVTLRATRANQLGLLGFGGDRHSGYRPMVEASAGLLLRPDTIIGVEYRQKPNNLRFAEEDDWQDFFIGYFPNKYLGIVAAYSRLGSIATIDNQSGLYLNLQASF